MNHSWWPLAPLKKSEITTALSQQPNKSEPRLGTARSPAHAH